MIKTLINILTGKAIVIDNVTNDEFNLKVGKNITKRKAKNLLATSLKSLMA